jgi:phage-related protein
VASQAMIDLVADLKGDAEDKLGGITGALGKLGLAGMGLGVLKGGFDAVVGGIGGFIDEAKDAERGASQLESVLKSTGGAAGLSKQQLLDMSSALSASGGLSQAADDAVLAGENMLLTFTNIKGPQFEGATQAILDMATAMNNGAAPSADQMKAQAIQLGKALNDPIKGLAALSKVGVAFTNDQKATIKEMINGKAASEALRDAGFELADETYKEIDANQKKYGTQEALRMSGLELDAAQQQVFDTMTKGGDIAGAQTLIMAELNKEFGGAAAASAQTYEGHMATMNERMNDVKEGIGKALLPAITSITDLIAGPGMDALMQLANVLQEYLPGAIAAAQAVLMPLLTGLIEAFQTSIPVAIGILKAAIDVLGATWQTLEPIISPIIDLITQNLQPILIGMATALLTVVIPAFVAWAASAGAAAVATWPRSRRCCPLAAIAAAVALLAAAWDNDWGGIRTTITDWWNTTGEPIFTQLKDWLGVQLTAALTTLSDFWTGTLQPALAQVWQFLTDSVFPALGTLLGWLADSIPPALQTLADFWNTILLPALSAVWSFIQDNVIPILKDVLTWIKDNLPPALKGLADLWNNTLQPALKTVWSFIQDSLIPILKDVLTWIKDNIPPAITALADLWNNTLKPALQAIWDFITLNLLPVFKSLVELGITVAHKALEALAGLWEKVISPALNALWTFIDTNLTPVLKTLVSDGLDKAHAAMDALAVIWNTVLGPALKVASDFIGGALKGALDGIGTALNNVKALFDALATAINNLTLPDWLTPGSPTPLEYGLLGIQDALRASTAAT